MALYLNKYFYCLDQFWGSRAGQISKSDTVLQMARHRLNIYARTCVAYVLCV